MMSLSRTGTITVILATLLVATCLTFSAEGLSGSTDRTSQNEAIVIQPANINEDSSIVELVMSYEKLSAEKKHYESKGFQVLLYDPISYDDDLFKKQITDEMKVKIGAVTIPYGNENVFSYSGDQSAAQEIGVMVYDHPEGPEVYSMEMTTTSGLIPIDIEFLEGMIEFIRKSDDKRSESSADELEEVLDEQKALLSKMNIILSTDDVSFIDIRTLEINREQSDNNATLSVMDEEEDVETEDGVPENKTTSIVCDDIQSNIFRGNEPVTNAVSDANKASAIGAHGSDI